MYYATADFDDPIKPFGGDISIACSQVISQYTSVIFMSIVVSGYHRLMIFSRYVT